MYRETSKNQPEFENFKLPFDGKLDKDIRYPTDISILNEAREKTEHIIDELFKPLVGKIKKPRTYRKRARKQFLSYTRRKQKGGRGLRKAIKQQLNYIRRNLQTISELLQNGSKLEDLNR